MLYRKFRCLDRETSLIGMGAMRLPLKEDGSVDPEKGLELMRHAIECGINYLDTAYTYHGGLSERLIGDLLKEEGYREKVILADKLPIWLVKEEADVAKYFDEQMRRLDVKTIDMYLVHNLVPDNWEKTRKYNVLPFLEKMKAEGKIGHIGFSFHGDYKLFQEIIDAYDWEFCQIQMNYVDQDQQATLEGLEYARQHGVDVIIMEPLKGGRIAGEVPESVQAIWNRAIQAGEIPAERSKVEWAFKWIVSRPGVTHILSGMSTMEQVDQNADMFSKEDLGEISEKEMALLDEVAAEYNKKIRHQCTACEYCLPCPQGLAIPDIIDYLNSWIAFGKNPNTMFEYTNWIGNKHASDCIHCGLCETKCPQGLKISDIMSEAEEAFGF